MALEVFAQKYVGEIQRSILSGTCENVLGRSSLGNRGRKADQRHQTAGRRSWTTQNYSRCGDRRRADPARPRRAPTMVATTLRPLSGLSQCSRAV